MTSAAATNSLVRFIPAAKSGHPAHHDIAATRRNAATKCSGITQFSTLVYRLDTQIYLETKRQRITVSMNTGVPYLTPQ
jgi:hypothetical protein